MYSGKLWRRVSARARRRLRMDDVWWGRERGRKRGRAGGKIGKLSVICLVGLVTFWMCVWSKGCSDAQKFGSVCLLKLNY